MFVRKDLFKKMGKFNSKYKVWADWVFNLKCFGHPKISTYFMDMIVAYYSDGGISSLENDPKFKKEKRLLFAKYERRNTHPLYRYLRILKEYLKLKFN